MKPVSDQEENELLIFHLRQLCEAKQKTHIHIDEAPMNTSNNTIPENTTSSGRFTLDILKNKAKKSLTSSLENIFSRDCSSGDSPPSTPPASPVALAGHPFPEEDSDSPQFRRRAHTFSHPPSASKKRITFQNGRSQIARRTRSESESSGLPSLPSSFSAPSFLKSLYQSSGKTASPPEGDPPRSDVEKRKRTSSVCSSDSLNAGGLTLAPRRISWRQRIFLRVASPMKKSPSAMQMQDGCDEKELLPLSPLPTSFDEVPLVSLLQNEDVQDQSGEKKNSEELQSLWRKAIHQQILLLRMEKENQKLEASRDELQSRKIKLDYEEVGTCQKDVINIWDKKLLNCRAKIRCDVEDIHTTLKDDLLKQLTAQQHAILVDLGQLSLFNLLKAYSLLDKEVGYCQGISFVAGVLLLHMSEEQAFEMLKFLMYDLGFRKQYRPDMMSLQIQMYQLSRLLHDYHRDLYHHLEENEISPNIIFLQGTEVIFKVALCLLSTQEESIMSCETFEGIVEFLKNTLPDMTQPQMEKIMAQVAHAKIQGVESNLEEALRRESQMMTLIRSLEEEKALYQKALEKICSYLPQEALSDCEELLKEVNCPPNKF
ncbi:TBC1 domain family member 4, partial [Ophiophagus hannah]